jgi:uncharacterized protein
VIRRITAAVLLLNVVAFGACRSGARTTAPVGGALVSFGRHSVAAEVADEKAEWGLGLMFRRHLARDAGMLFVFPELQGPSGFYMFNTLIPLQIAYLQRVDAGAYQVVAMREMVPCRSTKPDLCPTYDAGTGYNAALEVNRGWLDRAGVVVGDRVTVTFKSR